MHPLLLDDEVGSFPITTLKFTLYENLPNQKRCWRRLVDKYNYLHKDVHIAMEWVPLHVGRTQSYESHLDEIKPDLILLGHNRLPVLKQSGLLAPVSVHIRKLISPGKYWTESLGEARKSLTEYIVPVHLSPWIAVWNQRMADSLGLTDLEQKVQEEGLAGVLMESARHLGKRDAFATGNIWNYLMALGIPNSNGMKRFFLRRFEHLEKFAGQAEKIFITQQSHPTQALDLFLQQKMLFFVGSSFFVLHHFCASDFEIGGRWIIPEQGCFLPTGCTCIGVNAHTAHQHHAWRFVEFLVSKDAQETIAEEHMACPFLKAANAEFAELFNGATHKGLQLSLGSSRLFNRPANKLYHLMMYGLKDVYQDVLCGKLTPKAAAAEADRRLLDAGSESDPLQR